MKKPRNVLYDVQVRVVRLVRQAGGVRFSQRELNVCSMTRYDTKREALAAYKVLTETRVPQREEPTDKPLGKLQRDGSHEEGHTEGDHDGY